MSRRTAAPLAAHGAQPDRLHRGRRVNRRAFPGLGLAAALLLAACTTADIDPMERQPKLKPYAQSPLFADGRAMRQPPAGTISRERPLDVPQPAESAPGDPRLPIALTAALLDRGRDRFDIYCATCHGLLGDGDSVVADKMSQRLPTSLHQPRVRDLAPGPLFRIIDEGYGLMPSYRSELSVIDRWAVVAYVRALQRSQHARLADVPQPLRQQLEQKHDPPTTPPSPSEAAP